MLILVDMINYQKVNKSLKSFSVRVRIDFLEANNLSLFHYKKYDWSLVVSRLEQVMSALIEMERSSLVRDGQK
jgi:hypothetical protein